jgi:flagellar hook protein FlgE
MLTSLSSAVSGLDSFQQDMDVIGNNIANINTTGFKAGRVQFADSFSDTLEAATANSVQVGTGVFDQAIGTNWTAGAASATGINTDLAITGNGFFVVADPTTSAQYVTQDGSFSADPNGYLVTAGGQRVQGYSDAGLSTLGSIKIDTTGAPAASIAAGATVSSFTIDTKGKINVTLSDGTTFTRGQVLLQNFQDPQALVSQSGNLYSNQAAAGPLTAMSAPGSSGLGSIQSGALELSNVDLSSEMANLITAQRGFEANSKIVTTSDEVLQTLVNMKR